MAPNISSVLSVGRHVPVPSGKDIYARFEVHTSVNLALIPHSVKLWLYVFPQICVYDHTVILHGTATIYDQLTKGAGLWHLQLNHHQWHSQCTLPRLCQSRIACFGGSRDTIYH